MALKELLTDLEEGIQSYPNHNTPSTSGGFGYGGTRIFDSKTFRQRDFSFGQGTAYDRPGQDVRYSISCESIKNYGWTPKKNFDKEIVKLVNFYKKRKWKW